MSVHNVDAGFAACANIQGSRIWGLLRLVGMFANWIMAMGPEIVLKARPYTCAEGI